MSIIRERATGIGDSAYYRKHAPASSILWQDGDAVDAGTAIDIDNNIGVLCYQGCRRLVHSLGEAQASFKVVGDIYLGYGEIAQPVFGSSTPQYQEIYWGAGVSACFGPFPAIADRPGSGSGPLLRLINTGIDLFSSATNFISTDLYCAMTSSDDPGALFDGNYLAFAHASVSSGRKQQYFTLDSQTPVTDAMRDRWIARATSDLGATEALVIPIYIWFGWRFLNSTNQLAYINSMSAWETRDGSE